jgi:hypothetical protein
MYSKKHAFLEQNKILMKGFLLNQHYLQLEVLVPIEALVPTVWRLVLNYHTSAMHQAKSIKVY